MPGKRLSDHSRTEEGGEGMMFNDDDEGDKTEESFGGGALNRNKAWKGER
jgi:hypothetical protein